MLTYSGMLYITHLTVDQLRKRAADDRKDAMAMINHASPECIAMLLEDAQHCEERAIMLEQTSASSGIPNLEQ